jgi:extracellular elastinolytic metalloproteinase
VKSFNYLVLLIAFSGFFSISKSQAQTGKTPRETALEHLRANPTKFGLTAQDVAEVQITDEFSTDHNGLTHVWVQQKQAGIPVFNALFGLHVTKSGEVLTDKHRFVSRLSEKTNTQLPSLSAEKALELAINHLGFTGFAVPSLLNKENNRNFTFEGGAISKEPIKISAVYVVDSKGNKVNLAWSMVIAQANTSDVWSLRVDAQSGVVLDKNNRTVYCKAGHAHQAGTICQDEKPSTVSTQSLTGVKTATAPPSVDESYNVFAFPIESPAHGDRILVVNPAIPTASPFGWHDTNGVAGAEHTITRGNNVFAYDDIDDNDAPPAIANIPNGSPTLTFDFPYDPNALPEVNKNVAISNLFYTNNRIHDVTHLYGFDEKSGNFQVNNYGNGGLGSDEVIAEGLDGGGQDNANFSTPPDGGNGRMQMYTWTRSGGRLVTVNAPNSVQGQYSAAAATDWGATITDVPVTGEVVIVDDGTPEATLGCNAPVNDVNGKIVMIDRGVCQFGVKALNAEQQGAIACIICNFEDATAGMAAGTSGGSVTIPVVMMKKGDCDLLRQYAGNGLNISFVQPPNNGPEFLDGDFDNGIVAHEFGHGISNRLTGGPSQADCLNNPEQMGEGWGDWFSLIFSVKPTAVGTDKRGVGTYVLRQDNDGTGIRRHPYSTDMSINPLTFGDVAGNTEVHALGEVWTAVTWDLYWAFVEKYGFDADITNTNSGNGRAIKLVMDGMKLQPCSPGFIDGRDAILLADKANFASVDTCLIMSVFARRGFGVNADQGTSTSASDGIENFDPIPTCIKELKIKKVCTPTIDPGQDATFTITLTNHKDITATGVVVKDGLPTGLTLINASNGGTANGNQVVWNIGDMPSGQTLTLTYTAKSDAAMSSTRFFRDEMEASDDWLTYSSEGDEIFTLQDNVKKTGDFAWLGNNIDTETDYVLENFNPITIAGNKPVLRFWHQYDTEKGSDAGFLEFKKGTSQQWLRVPADKLLRNPYDGDVQYGTFAIPFLSGFSGSSNGWKQSYLDLSDFLGEQVTFRFRFGSDGNTAGQRWVVDDVEMMDMLKYDETVCITSSQGDNVCAKAPEQGVIVNPNNIIGTKEDEKSNIQLNVQPNPATDILRISVNTDLQGAVTFEMYASDGQLVKSQNVRNLFASNVVQMDIIDLPSGFYFLKVKNDEFSAVQKVVVKR